MAKVSIQDIADKLGVSKGTVSLVLSGKAIGSRISEETCRRVKQMADELNYYPNEVARSLSTGTTMSIGVVVTDISNEFFGYLTFYIQEQAKKYGYTVITINTNEDLKEFDNAITVLLNRRIDGIIFVPVAEGQKVAEKIIERQVPMVQIDRFYPGINASYIIANNYKVSAEAIEMLINKGYQRIAVICYDINLNALMERRRGCIDVLDHHGILDLKLIKNINYEDQEEDLRRSILDIKSSPDKVDAIFFCSRKVFITGIKYMHQEGMKIPDDIEVVCFDKIESFSIANIPINYIEQPIKEMGEKAVDILMEQIKGSKHAQQCILEAKLVFNK